MVDETQVPEEGIASPLRDFLFDLYDSVRTSQIPTEQHALYTGAFRDLTAKHFSQSPWPSPQEIADECDGDPLFLALYHELTHRHLHTIIRPNVHDRIDGWHVYRTLFDILIEEFDQDGGEVEEDASTAETQASHPPPPLYILPEWAFDILHEFVYQFQGFCQFRISNMALANKFASLQSGATSSSSSEDVVGHTAAGETSAAVPKKQPSAHLLETIRVLNENKDAWAAETVFYYLHRLISLGSERNTTSKKKKRISAAMQYLGVFASVTLSRMECLLGDHSAAIAAVIPLMVSPTHSNFYGMIHPPQAGLATTSGLGGAMDEVINPNLMVTLKSSTPDDIISSVLAARISMSYHAGVSFLMLRRYKDAIRTLSSMCASMQRGLFKSVGYSPTTTSSQQQGLLGATSPSSSLPSSTVAHRKNLPVGFDQNVKMYDRMLALLAILYHVCTIHPSLVDETVQRILLDRHRHQLAKMESGEEEVMEDLFMSACPKFVLATVPDYDSAFTGTSFMYAAQDAIQTQVKHFVKEVSSAASNRKLRSYMKLYTSISVEKLGRLMSEDALPSLLAYKHKLYQLEAQDQQVTDLATDIHFFIQQNIILVDEEEKRRSFDSYFLEKIAENTEILAMVNQFSL